MRKLSPLASIVDLHAVLGWAIRFALLALVWSIGGVFNEHH